MHESQDALERNALDRPGELDMPGEIVRLNMIIQALMQHAERSTNLQGSDFNIFQTAMILDEQVRGRTAELEEALRAKERAERALGKSEAKFAALFALTPNPMALTRLADGVMLDVSRSYAENFGYWPDDMVGRSTLPGDLGLWVNAEHRRQWQTAVERDGETLDFETQMRRKDGGIVTVLISGKAVEIDGTLCAIVNIHDITERKETEKRLQMAMQALETTRECVYWISEDGCFLYVNPAVERELGYSAEELRRMTVADIDPNTPAEFWGPDGEFIRRLKAEGLQKFLTVHRHRDGHLIPVEVDSDPFCYDGKICFIAIARDISARLAVEKALRKSEAKFAAIFSLTPNPMALIRLDDAVVLEISHSFADYFGYRPDELLGQSTLPDALGLWVTPEQQHQWKEEIIRDGEVLGFEAVGQHKDGSAIAALISGKLVEMDGERCVIIDIHDITERKQHDEHLEQIAHHDPLTGLPNRLLLDDRLRQAISQNQRSGTRVAVCFLDLDGFKQINDRLGHQAGDQLLIEVARRLVACVRGGDTVARLGGDEFVVLLSGLTCDDECRMALDRLLRTVAAPYRIGASLQAGLSVSIGVTLFPSDPVDPDTLVRHADHAMYAAKQSGKNQYQMFDPLIEQRIEARHATLRRLATAQETGEFRLYYQPQVDCRRGRIIGAEALIRWQHPTLGLLPPAEFLPLIEDTDLALVVGEWVIREALSQLVLWRRQGLDLCVSVNAFSHHLLRPDFVGGLGAILDQYPGIGRDRLQIEIVETAALKDLDVIRQVVEGCRQLGIAFSLDDFGTGYSTLAHLRHLPASEIKIDQSFVRHMLERTEDLAIVEAVIGLGHAFGRSLVAEGVETQAHIGRLLTLGCDVMQGYALARPMAADDLPRWVRAFRPHPAWDRPAGAHGEP